jgi:hypothetical protein
MERPLYIIEIHTDERVVDGLRTLRYTAIQKLDEKFLASESYESAEDAVRKLASYAEKCGGFLKHEF